MLQCPHIVVQPECFAAKEIKKRSHWFFPRCQHRPPCCVLRCRNVCHFVTSPSSNGLDVAFAIWNLFSTNKLKPSCQGGAKSKTSELRNLLFHPALTGN